jgi:hypothetical protein
MPDGQFEYDARPPDEEITVIRHVYDEESGDWKDVEEIMTWDSYFGENQV